MKNNVNNSCFSCKKWVAACGRPYLMCKTVVQLNKGFKICSDHFQEFDYATSKMCRLKPSAIPCFNVGKYKLFFQLYTFANHLN